MKQNKFPQLVELNENDIYAGNEAEEIKEIEALVMQRNKPSGLFVLLHGMHAKQSFSIVDQNKGTYCFTNGFNIAALHFSEVGIKKSTVHTPNIFRNLSLYFTDKKKYELAEKCSDKAE